MYLRLVHTPLDRFEYMRIPVDLVPQKFIDAYNLQNKIYKGFLYVEIRKAFMDYHKQESSPINYFAPNSSPTVTTKLLPLAYGHTHHTPNMIYLGCRWL